MALLLGWSGPSAGAWRSRSGLRFFFAPLRLRAFA
jgi:hypothetical protein